MEFLHKLIIKISVSPLNYHFRINCHLVVRLAEKSWSSEPRVAPESAPETSTYQTSNQQPTEKPSTESWPKASPYSELAFYICHGYTQQETNKDDSKIARLHFCNILILKNGLYLKRYIYIYIINQKYQKQAEQNNRTTEQNT